MTEVYGKGSADDRMGFLGLSAVPDSSIVHGYPLDENS